MMAARGREKVSFSRNACQWPLEDNHAQTDGPYTHPILGVLNGLSGFKKDMKLGGWGGRQGLGSHYTHMKFPIK